jgi:hypothetical protein
MKIRTKKNNKKTTLLILGALLLVAIACSTFYYMHHFQVGLFTPKKQAISSQQKSPAIVNYGSTTDQEKSAGNAIKEQTSSSASSSTPAPSQGKTTIPIEITTASQSGSVVYVRSVIHTTTSQGSCSLTMKGPNDKVYTATAPVQPLSSTSTCAGFNIQASSLSSGQWGITINFSNDSTTGSGQSSIEVK